MREKIARFLEFFFNLSLFWKVGFVIGACVLIGLFLTFSFFFWKIVSPFSLAIRTELQLYFERFLRFLTILVLIFLIWGIFALYFGVKKLLNRKKRRSVEPTTNLPVPMMELKNVSCFKAGEGGSWTEELIRPEEVSIQQFFIGNDEDLRRIYTKLSEILEKQTLDSQTYGSFVKYEVLRITNIMIVVDDDDDYRAKRGGKEQRKSNYVCTPIISEGGIAVFLQRNFLETGFTSKSKKR